MKSDNEGFSTPLAMIIIFSLTVIVLSVAMLVTANNKKISSYNNLIKSKKEAESVIFDIQKELQALIDIPCDSELNPVIHSLLDKYQNLSLSIKDASTGINPNFMSEKFYENKSIKAYITMYGNDSFVDYSWINSKHSEKDLKESFSLDFGTDNLFPLINNYPQMNVYNMSQDFIKAILEYCGIKKAEEKSKQIKDSLYSDFDLQELAKILEVEKTHSVFDFLGTKTVFWKITFETTSCYASAVYALIPENETSRKIKEYKLVEKNISLKGGTV